MSHQAWVRGIELGSSERAVLALNFLQPLLSKTSGKYPKPRILLTSTYIAPYYVYMPIIMFNL